MLDTVSTFFICIGFCAFWLFVTGWEEAAPKKIAQSSSLKTMCPVFVWLWWFYGYFLVSIVWCKIVWGVEASSKLHH